MMKIYLKKKEQIEIIALIITIIEIILLMTAQFIDIITYYYTKWYFLNYKTQ